MFHVVLFEPEIPPNTGNIIRLCANSGVKLHLVQPLGFKLDHRQLQRAGLDYHEYADIKLYRNWQECARNFAGQRVFAITTKGKTRYSNVNFLSGDVFLFGPESRGLPAGMLDKFPSRQRLRVPMLNSSRSLNLSNAVAVIIYEAWRQNGFKQGT